jgi:hypothetical protein
MRQLLVVNHSHAPAFLLLLSSDFPPGVGVSKSSLQFGARVIAPIHELARKKNKRKRHVSTSRVGFVSFVLFVDRAHPICS